MAYILDLIVVLIGAFCIWRGWRRGLVHTAAVLAGIVLGAMLANQLAPAAADWIYDTQAAPRIENALVDRITSAGSLQTDVDLSGLLGNREELGRFLAEHGIPSSVTVGVPDLSEESVRQALKPTMENTVKPAATLLLTAVSKVVMVLLFLVLALLLAQLADLIFKLPVLKQINQFGGILLGIAHGIFWTMVFAAAVQLALHYGWFGDRLTAQMVEDTRLLSYLTEHNWII